MSRPAPALIPLFRSDQQLRLLADLFGNRGEEVAVGELAKRAGIAQATASREVARLARHGLVLTRALGRNTLVSANWSLPWAKELHSILVQTVGILGRLSDALSDLAGVEGAFVYGSWAARYIGEPGPAPRDIDVLVIGDTSLRAVRQACRGLEEDLRVSVNPAVLNAQRWNSTNPEPFVAEVRSRPIVPIPLDRA